ncbi:MAG: hypothetical protein JO202_08545 [Ktedonobacteraceae bacterium]|nr:hypothetical protein [Ktedonobacteraceae bacterium]
MQQVARKLVLPSYPNPNDHKRGPSPVLALTAIFMFAFSGLLIGFAVGALAHRQAPPTQTADSKQNTHQLITQAQPPTQTTTVQKVELGCPLIGSFNASEIANGSVSYKLSVQVRDKSGGACGSGNPVHAPGITCKVWLTADDHINQTLKSITPSRLAKTDTLAQPMPNEVENGLIFDPATPQTQLCDEQGHITWKYSINPSVQAGPYSLLVLTDWKGVSSNWSWVYITVQKNG